MTDILITPHRGYRWGLALRKGVVVRTSAHKPNQALSDAVGRVIERDPEGPRMLQAALKAPRELASFGGVRITLPLHCGHHMHDDPKELAHMRRVIAQEEKING